MPKIQKNLYVVVVTVLINCLFLSSCVSGFDSKKISEGKITYSIEYPKSANQSPLVSLLPPTLEMKFKENNTVMNIKGFGGTFFIIYITNLRKKKNYSLLKILKDQYIYEADTTDAPFGYTEMDSMYIEKSADTATICGYLCHKALAYCPKISTTPLELYYTNEIGIKTPNTNNPFRQIDGVLLSFEVRLSNINMKMKAIEISKQKIDDDCFKIPDNYQHVSRTELESIIESYTKTN